MPGRFCHSTSIFKGFKGDCLEDVLRYQRAAYSVDGETGWVKSLHYISVHCGVYAPVA